MFPYHLLSFVRMTSLDPLHIIYTLCTHHLCIILISFIVICVLFLYVIYCYLCTMFISFIVICENDVDGSAAYYIHIMYTPLVHYFYIIYCYLCNIFVYYLLLFMECFHIIYCHLWEWRHWIRCILYIHYVHTTCALFFYYLLLFV